MRESKHRLLVIAATVLAWVALQVPGQAQTPAPGPRACTGDCNADGSVTIDELLTLIGMALGRLPGSACVGGTGDSATPVTVDAIAAAASHALNGCLVLDAAVRFDELREPINSQLLGTGGVAPYPEDMALLHTALSPPYARLDVGFEDSGCPDDPSAGSLYHPQDNSFDYCRLDQRLLQAQAIGAKPLLIIDYTPAALVDAACAATNGHGFGAQHCAPNDNAKYGALVQAMVRHVYTAYGATDFEVWNEPDWVFFAGTLDQYLQIYATCNAAVVRAERDLGLAPGTFHVGGPAAASPDRRWINALLAAAVADPSLRVDFISWHTYANNLLAGEHPDPALYAGTYGDGTERVRGWVAPFQAQRADLHPLLWIDEWNVNALFDPRMDTACAAAFTAAALHAMQDAGLDRAARFNTWDSTPASGGLIGNWGLLTNDGRVRPALYGLAFWHELAASRVTVELLDAAARARDTSSRTRYAQNLVASFEPASGRAVILLYDFGSYTPPEPCGGGPDLEVTLDLHGLADATYQITQQQVDCATAIQPASTAAISTTHSNVAVVQQSGQVSVRVPADAVVLLTLARP